MGTPAVKSETENLRPIKRPKLAGKNLKLEEFARRRHFIMAPPGMTKEDLQYPEAFSELVGKVARHDIVYVLSAEEDWEAEYRVETVKAASIAMRPVKVMPRTGLDQAETPLDAGHYVQHRPGDGWCVIRRADSHVLIKGHTIKESACAQFYRELPKKAA